MNSLFLTNKNDLYAEISGGVQLCSQEFLEVIRLISNTVEIYEIKISKNLKHRLIRFAGFDYYHLYNTKYYQLKLIEILKVQKIDIVFINKAELVRFSKVIKNEFGTKIKVVVLSHGNESGDFLHDLTHPSSNISKFKLLKNKVRLGFNLYTESYFRHRYIDLVCAMSEEEVAIEKWLGAKQVFYFPRLIVSKEIGWNPKLGRFGFVGTLNHTPNLIALEQICVKLNELQISNLEIRLVGSGEKEGRNLESKYKFVSYLGRLDDVNLETEACTWLYFLNPIFWYSRGASMKLGQALSWGIPVISTSAGARGYKFKKGLIPFCNNNVESFVEQMIGKANDMTLAKNMFQKLINIEAYKYCNIEIGQDLAQLILELNSSSSSS